MFGEGKATTEDTRGGPNRSTPLKDERITLVRNCLRVKRGWSVRNIADVINIPYVSLWRILTEIFGLQKLLGEFIPHALTEDQMQARWDL